MSQPLLDEIHAFLRRTGMGPSYFGRLAAGNTEIVRRLESGGTITLRTAERLRAFMAAHRNGASNSTAEGQAHDPNELITGRDLGDEHQPRGALR